MATAPVNSAELPAGFTLDPAELPAGFKLDEPKEKRGVGEALAGGLLGAGAATVDTLYKVVGGAVAKAADSVHNVMTGRDDTFYQDALFAEAQKQKAEKQQAIAETTGGGKEETTGTEIAGAVGGMPGQMVNAGLGLGGAERAMDVVERGGTLGQAAVAGGTQAALDAASLAVPATLGKTAAGVVGGSAAKQIVAGALTGGAVNAATGFVSRAAGNAALPEGKEFEDLRQENSVKATAMDVALGGVMGAAHSASARRAKLKAEAEAAPPFPKDKMEDLGNGEYRTPNGSTITEDDWKTRSQKVRDGWMEEPPVEEKPKEPTKTQEEIDRLREEHPSGPVAAVLEQVAKKREADRQKKAQADELRAAADKTTDVEIKKALNAQADKLDPRKIPVGETKEGQPPIAGAEPPEKIPAGKATEGQPEIKTEQPKKIPAGEATEVPEPYEGQGIPKAEASEALPTGEATEVEPIPAGEAREVPEGVTLTEQVPAGEAKELYIPPEKRNATGEVTKQGGPGPEHQAGTGRGQTAEAGNRNRAERPAEGGRGQPERGAKPKVAGADEKASADLAGPATEKGEALDVGEFPKIDESLMDQARREPLPAPEATKPVTPRGREQVRAAIDTAVKEGRLSKDAGSLANWILERNPHVGRHLGVSIEEKHELGALGSYNPTERLVRLFKATQAESAAHEILHHTERMMPDEVQRGIRKEWRRNLDAAMKKATSEQRAAMADAHQMMHGKTAEDRYAAQKRMVKAFKDGVLNKAEHYKLADPSEFWAVNGARILHERFKSRGTWRGKALLWLRDFVEHAKSTLGIRSDSAVIKALDHVMNPEKNQGRGETGGNVGRQLATTEKLAAEGKLPKEQLDVAAKEPKKPEELPPEDRKDRFVRAWTDRFNRVARMQKEAAPKSEKADIYLHDTLFNGRAQHRGDMLEKQHIKPLGKALEALKKVGLKVSDADDYLTALHAPERNREIAKINEKLPDGGSGMTNKQAADIIKGYTPEQRAALDVVAERVRAMNKDKLDALVKDGLITQELRDTLDRKYKSYVPLKDLEGEDAFLGIGQGYALRATDVKEALGRSSRSSSPIAASMMDAMRGIVRGEKARVDRSIWEYAGDKDQKFIQPYDQNKPPPQVMKRVKGSDGKVKSVIDPNKVNDYTLPLMVDGEMKRVFVADKILRDQLKKLASTNDVGPWLSKIGHLTGTIGRMLTEFNPAFTVPNAVRDAITAGLRAKAHGISPGALMNDIWKSWGQIINYKRGADTPGAKQYEEFLTAGGKTGAYGVTDFSETIKKLEKMGADISDTEHGTPKYWRVTRDALGQAAHLMSNANEVIEYATRFAAYKQARAKGMSVNESARIAKEITVNFNRSGEQSRRLNAVLVFANAAFQGARQTVVYAKHPAVVKGMLGLAALGAAAQAWNENVGGMDEETGEFNANTQSDVVADKNMQILMPGSRTGLKIPMPPEYAFPFTIGRRLYRLFSQGDVGREVGGIIGSVFDAALPVRLPEAGPQGGLSKLKALVPTTVAPFADLLTNTNYFGQPIVPSRHEDKSPAPYFKYSRRGTSDTAKELAKGLNAVTGGDEVKPGKIEEWAGPLAAPEGMEYLLGYYTGGVGQLAMQSKNLAKAATAGEPVSVNQVPVINRFLFDEPKSYTNRRFQELAPDFQYALDYEKAGQDSKIDPKIRRALDTYRETDKELRSLFKQLKTANDTERVQLEKEIKSAQSRVIRAYNGQQVQ